jgi:hypothetical protein
MTPQKIEATVLMVAENTVRQNPLKAALGDLFLTESGLFFLPYEQFIYTGKLGGGVGDLLGQLAGGVIQASQQEGKLDNAKTSAIEDRKKQYGLSLQERMSKNKYFEEKWGVSIPKVDILSLDISQRMNMVLCQWKSGDPIEFYVGKLSEQQAGIINRYLKEANINPIIDDKEYGFNLHYPAPGQFVILLKNEQKPDHEMVAEMLNNKKYTDILYEEVKKLHKKDMLKVCNNIVKSEPYLAALLIKKARIEIEGHKSLVNRILWSLFGAIFIGLWVVSGGIREWLKMGTPDFSILSSAGGSLFFLTPAAGILLYAFLPPGKANAMLKSLEGRM